MSALLNYKLQGKGENVVLIHGLFGDSGNLGLLARELVKTHQVLSIDLRNHGQSFHSDQHNYSLMADDVIALLDHLAIKTTRLIGHSMGGKVAMKLSAMNPERISKLIVMDMAPVAYQQRHHDHVFAGLFAVDKSRPASRSAALALMAEHISEEGVRQFLAKSLYKDGDVMRWRFNLSALYENYSQILGWSPQSPCSVATLFLKGANSDYLNPMYQAEIQAQFPNAKGHVVANTGHWLHAEKPAEVLRVINKFMHE